MKGQETIYNREGESYLIEVNLSTIAQLFNSLDPAPFREKDLDPAAEEYIVSAAGDFSLQTPIKLVIHLPGEIAASEQAKSLPEAVHNYFDYRRMVMAHHLRQTMQIGHRALLIGLGFLITCILAQQVITSLGREGLFWSIIEEGFLISGWVAMWYPINLFLYEWWPTRKRQQLYGKLAQIATEIRALT
ncbi:MAG: hypothetical protein OEZ16_12970 [Chromatiales bacterium]|nr:hypothetical protein [Chromatiales bacterium]